MPKRSSKKRPSDPNSLAAMIVAESTTEEPPKKNPHAVALGRKGGKIGGKARAKALTAERKREIAKAAAEARWGKRS
jgi:hypothetical protein